MHRRIATLIALLLALSGTTFIALAATGSPAFAKDLNCDDFNTQAQAQSYFNNNGGGPNNNVDGLDSDGDGVVCESNPCPCGNGGDDGGNNNGGSQQPKKAHTINVRGVEVGNTGKFLAVGRVPTFRGQIQLQRKVKGGTFKAYKKTLAKKPDGKVRTAFNGPTGSCFQVVVPSTKTYRLTAKQIGCITAE